MSVPFKWYPGQRVLTQAFLWRLLDLTEADGAPIDMVVATKFPSYCVRHPNKVVWLLHQFRQAYELDRTELGQFSESAEDRALRRRIQRLERDCARRGAEAVRDLRQRGGAAPALDRARGRGAPAPAAGARLPHGGIRTVRALRQPARPGEAHRPADRGGGPAGRGRRDRRRRARPRTARVARERSARGSRGESRSRSWPTSMPAAAPSSTRRSTRTSAWCRSRRSCPRSLS